MSEWTEQQHTEARARCDNMRPFLRSGGRAISYVRQEKVFELDGSSNPEPLFLSYAVCDLPDVLAEIERLQIENVELQAHHDSMEKHCACAQSEWDSLGRVQERLHNLRAERARHNESPRWVREFGISDADILKSLHKGDEREYPPRLMWKGGQRPKEGG